ncbi:hypothetical protein [Nitriliruptor alkaliphilus]|uniref:hypothetical protein n=1 Tax=Nitriliruptor alkaliphilus TaxID=427918 RepID=UPI000AC3AA12|nr:hypothetical protein [Nitriliruptor alkaliphilus]
MAFEEKRAWAMGVVTVVAYATYLAIVLRRAGGGELTEVAYAATMLWTIGAAIVAAIVIHIGLAIASPEDADRRDQRDREIERFGAHVGHSFVVMGALAALLLALTESAPFWIANVIYLAFALSAVLESIARIVAYRRGFQPW